MSSASGRSLSTFTVCALATARLEACVCFDQLGVRFDADGDLTLADACHRYGADLEDVLAVLTPVFGGDANRSASPCCWALDAACRSLVYAHHGPLRAGLLDLRIWTRGLVEAHASLVPGGGEIRSHLDDFAEALLEHFAQEENLLFPAFRELAESCRCLPLAHPQPAISIARQIRAMEAEHDRLENDLRGLRRQLGDLVTAPTALGEWQHLEEALTAFAITLAAHARFEQQQLFTHALALQHELSRAGS